MSHSTPTLSHNVSVLVSRDTASAYTLCARTIVDQAHEAIESRGKLTIALSGGSTPKKLYELLASPGWVSKFPWDKTEFFWGDERYVATTDPVSNFHMTQQAMLERVKVPSANVHRVRTEEADAGRAAELYEQEIRRIVPAPSGGLPHFDLILLGLGTNGHTASLFPYQPALHEKERLVIAEYIEEVKMTRVTLSVPLINAAKQILFIALGEDKAVVVRDVVTGVFDPERLPAQLIRPADGRLTWILDPAAAEKLPPEIVTHE
ncbi:MAG TPA: 6-phosphogluconolactonase [Terriglobales bacterium]|nr:6-phosphogluconolactonase [Terriglobales bacterium]